MDEGETKIMEVAGAGCEAGSSGVEGTDNVMYAAWISTRSLEHDHFDGESQAVSPYLAEC